MRVLGEPDVRTHYSQLKTALFVVVVLRQSFEILQKDERLVRRDLEALAACLARHFVVHADEVVLHFREDLAVALTGALGDLRLSGAAYPPHRVVAGPATPGTLQPRGALLGSLIEELSLVHGISVSLG